MNSKEFQKRKKEEWKKLYTYKCPDFYILHPFDTDSELGDSTAIEFVFGRFQNESDCVKKMVEFIQENKVDINTKLGERGKTILLKRIDESHGSDIEEEVQLLLELGADPLIPGNNGITSLHRAAIQLGWADKHTSGNGKRLDTWKNVFNMLLAKVTPANLKENTMINYHWANYPEYVKKALQEKGFVHNPALQKEYETIEKELQYGYIPDKYSIRGNARNNTGSTPLDTLIQKIGFIAKFPHSGDATPYIKELDRLLATPDLNVNVTDSAGRTVIFDIINYGDIETLKKLLQRGLDPKKPAFNGYTPIRDAVLKSFDYERIYDKHITSMRGKAVLLELLKYVKGEQIDENIVKKWDIIPDDIKDILRDVGNFNYEKAKESVEAKEIEEVEKRIQQAIKKNWKNMANGVSKSYHISLWDISEEGDSTIGLLVKNNRLETLKKALAYLKGLDEENKKKDGEVDYTETLVYKFVNYPDGNKIIPLLFAIQTENEEMVKLLVEEGAEPQLQIVERHMLPIQYASELASNPSNAERSKKRLNILKILAERIAIQYGRGYKHIELEAWNNLSQNVRNVLSSVGYSLSKEQETAKRLGEEMTRKTAEEATRKATEEATRETARRATEEATKKALEDARKEKVAREEASRKALQEAAAAAEKAKREADAAKKKADEEAAKKKKEKNEANAALARKVAEEAARKLKEAQEAAKKVADEEKAHKQELDRLRAEAEKEMNDLRAQIAALTMAVEPNTKKKNKKEETRKVFFSELKKIYDDQGTQFDIIKQFAETMNDDLKGLTETEEQIREKEEIADMKSEIEKIWTDNKVGVPLTNTATHAYCDTQYSKLVTIYNALVLRHGVTWESKVAFETTPNNKRKFQEKMVYYRGKMIEVETEILRLYQICSTHMNLSDRNKWIVLQKRDRKALSMEQADLNAMPHLVEKQDEGARAAKRNIITAVKKLLAEKNKRVVVGTIDTVLTFEETKMTPIISELDEVLSNTIVTTTNESLEALQSIVFSLIESQEKLLEFIKGGTVSVEVPPQQKKQQIFDTAKTFFSTETPMVLKKTTVVPPPPPPPVVVRSYETILEDIETEITKEGTRQTILLNLVNEAFSTDRTHINDVVDEEGNTLLMIMLRNRMTNVITRLLELGADVNIQNNDGLTALMIAILNINPSNVREYGAINILRAILNVPTVNVNLFASDAMDAYNYASAISKSVRDPGDKKQFEELLNKIYAKRSYFFTRIARRGTRKTANILKSFFSPQKGGKKTLRLKKRSKTRMNK